ncbi:Hsp20/alpha crystallin family protein [Fulvivirga sp. M361]|uniref:Hsp20/alpha crystallin family protein n=1 Tax=Fulvivirga sp. M361 TaxID=2594266 RepID=UPI00117BA1D2|nr:Hsp20/alpha crystallin family protein [Fulvivirga sp. M361]TRX52031.1 Hsp20/alpha crystallin family protein [Fulvivirga sp. M361]
MNIVKRSNFSPSTSFFDDFLTRDLFGWSGWTNEGTIMPRSNILETNNDFRVEVAAPGLSKKDFQVSLDNDMLTVQTQISENAQQTEDQNYTRKEFSYQSFKRSFYLPNTVEVENIEATYKDGILRLVIPKKEEARKKPVRTISIS